MSHAAKEGAVIYSGAFAGLLLQCFTALMSVTWICVLCFLLDSFASLQLSRLVKHLSLFKLQPISIFCLLFLSHFFLPASICPYNFPFIIAASSGLVVFKLIYFLAFCPCLTSFSPSSPVLQTWQSIKVTKEKNFQFLQFSNIPSCVFS